MKTLAAVALIVAAFPAHAADFGQPWDTGDKVFGGVALAATLLDWRQTLYVARHPETLGDMNPALGRHPSIGRVNNYFVATIAFEGFAAHLMPPKYRKLFLAGSAVLEINLLVRGATLGIPF